MVLHGVKAEGKKEGIIENEAQRNDRVTKEFFMQRSGEDIRAALQAEQDTLTTYHESLVANPNTETSNPS